MSLAHAPVGIIMLAAAIPGGTTGSMACAGLGGLAVMVALAWRPAATIAVVACVFALALGEPSLLQSATAGAGALAYLTLPDVGRLAIWAAVSTATAVVASVVQPTVPLAWLTGSAAVIAAFTVAISPYLTRYAASPAAGTRARPPAPAAPRSARSRPVSND